MNKYLRNEAIGAAIFFLVTSLWRYLFGNFAYDPFYRVEMVELAVVGLALLSIAFFYSRSCTHIYVLFIGIGLLGIAPGIGIGSVIAAHSVYDVSFSQLLSSGWEQLGMTAVSLLVLIVWIYRIGKTSTSRKPDLEKQSNRLDGEHEKHQKNSVNSLCPTP